MQCKRKKAKSNKSELLEPFVCLTFSRLRAVFPEKEKSFEVKISKFNHERPLASKPSKRLSENFKTIRNNSVFPIGARVNFFGGNFVYGYSPQSKYPVLH